MNSPDPVETELERLCHAGPPLAGALTGVAGSVARGCAVQFSARLRNGCLYDVRFNAFGGPAVIAACEACCRLAAQGLAVGTATDWLVRLDLPRSALAALLIVEDAWRDLINKLQAAGDAPARE